MNTFDTAIQFLTDKKINSVLVRYLLVGLVNTVFGYSVFALLAFVGLHYTLALFFSTVAGVLFSFRSFGRLVFKNAEWRLIWRFLAVYVLMYTFNVACVYVLRMYTHNIYTAYALAIVLISGLGFILNRRFVYA